VSLDLAAFLRARLDEDEQTARAASEYASETWRVDPDGETLLLWDPMPETPGMGHTISRRITPHIARHDPARVLAEVVAKRQVAKLHFRRRAHGWDEPGVIGFECAQCCDRYPCQTLRLHALPFSGHADYRPEWAPDA
jgi:hypothetical protein